MFAELSTPEPPKVTPVLVKRAVVLGASIAGLMAARVLSDHAEEVLVIERGADDQGGAPRPGVPQGTQVHALLAAGSVQLERWFPGFAKEAVAEGARLLPEDGSGFVLFINGEKTMPLAAADPGDAPVLVSSRPFLENLVRRCTRYFPSLYGEIATRARMIGDIATYHQADSRRRDFDELDRVPAGLFAAGDAVASFNPIYGQGMTAAMLHASRLSRYLRSQPDPAQPAKAYFDLVRMVVDSAWQTSTLADLELPHVDGPYPKGYRLTKWFSGVMLKASRVDPVINGKLVRVTTMLAHPDTLSGLGTVLRALWVSRRKA